MLKCAWCMKKLKNNKPLYGIHVKFAEGVDYSDKEGTIIHIHLESRNTSVPLIVTAKGSEAKEHGVDGSFAICSEKCGHKMQDALQSEIKLFPFIKALL